MSNKYIYGVLPCKSENFCPLWQMCGGEADFLAPFSKEMCCLLSHTAELAKTVHSEEKVSKTATFGQVYYRMLYAAREAVRHCAKMALKTEEAKKCPDAFWIATALLTRCADDYRANFWAEEVARMNAAIDALSAERQREWEEKEKKNDK